MKEVGSVKLKKGEKIEFAIVPKTGDITGEVVIKIGTYTGTGKTEKISLSSIVLKEKYNKYGVTAIALVAKTKAASKSKAAFKALKAAAEDPKSSILKSSKQEEVAAS